MTFPMVPFTDVLTAIVDNRGRTCPVGDSGRPLIATNCVKNTGLYPSYDTIRYVDDNTYSTWFRGHPRPGDILFVCKGAPGSVAMVPDPVDFCIAQDMVAVRADPRKVHPNYLFAALRSREVQTQIGTMHVGTMIPHFKKGDFGKLLIPMPPRDLQELIGNTYVELSKKIESNSRIAKLARQLLAARFASESSLVVWDVPLAEWAVLSRGVEPGRDKCNQDGDGLPFIRVGDLGKDDTGLWTNTDTSAVARETDVLVSFDGTPGRVAVGMTGVFSSGIRRVDPVNGLVTPGVLLALFESAEVQQVIRDYATGTTILHAGASIPHIKVPALDSTVLRSLAAEADELVARLRASTRESGVLRRTRDALLEDLLSGHLRVREAEEVVGSA